MPIRQAIPHVTCDILFRERSDAQTAKVVFHARNCAQTLPAVLAFGFRVNLIDIHQVRNRVLRSRTVINGVSGRASCARTRLTTERRCFYVRFSSSSFVVFTVLHILNEARASEGFAARILLDNDR